MMTLWLGCGGSDKPYYLPVDSPARPFVPPETEDLVGDAGDEDWDDSDGVDVDGDGDGDSGSGLADAATETRQAITMTLVRSRHAFETCYKRALERAPTLRGRVELVLEVGADGVPISAKATGIPGVAPCVAEVARGLVFPEPKTKKPIVVAHPFVFAPSS
jgi:hypothetical protein